MDKLNRNEPNGSKWTELDRNKPSGLTLTKMDLSGPNQIEWTKVNQMLRGYDLIGSLQQ